MMGSAAATSTLALSALLFTCLTPLACVAPDAVHKDTFGSEWTAADGVLSRVLYSPPFKIRPGQIILQNHIPVDFISEPAAVTNMASDLVDELGNSVPLSQAYMHHWLFEGSSPRQEIPGFGAGSEYRGLPEGFKKPFALMVGGDETWRATLHLLDLRMTPPELHLPSLECRRRSDCAEGPCLGPQAVQQYQQMGLTQITDDYPGGLFCCDPEAGGSSQFDFSRRGFAPAGLPTLTYRLKYTIDYVPLNIPVSQMDFGLRPLLSSSWQHRFVNVYGTRLQVSAPGLEYSIPVCADGDDMCIDVKINTWRITRTAIDCVDCPAAWRPSDDEDYLSDALPSARVGIAWAAGHQHDGALGIQFWLQRPGETTKELVCHSAPVIGSEVGVAGNEAGFVTGQMPCRLDQPIEVPVGSIVSIHSIYDAHRPKYSLDGYYTPKDGQEYAHVGVMGYMRIRWVDMDAYEAVAASTAANGVDPSVSNSAAGGMSANQLAQLLIGLDLSATQREQLQQAMAGIGK